MDKRTAGSHKESQRWTKGDNLQQKQQLFTVQGSERFKKTSHSGKGSDKGLEDSDSMEIPKVS